MGATPGSVLRPDAVILPPELTNTLRKDLAIALAVFAVIFGAAFGLNSMRKPLAPTPSKPYEIGLKAGSKGKEPENVVMRINGVPVSEEELGVAFQQLPEEMQRQFAGPTGKRAFAEQYVQYKLLEQEGEKQGIENDPHVQAVLEAQRASIFANATMAKLVKVPGEQDVRRYYDQHKGEFTGVELSHIVIAVQGGQLPPRKGGAAPSEQQALQKAVEVARRLQGGADFAQLAAAVSDDPNTAPNGGSLGLVSKGMLPPEIEAQVFRVPPGGVSGPIASRLGIHIFKLGQPVVQPYETVKTAVANRVRQQAAMDRLASLRKAAKVDFDPKYFPAAKPGPSMPGAPAGAPGGAPQGAPPS